MTTSDTGETSQQSKETKSPSERGCYLGCLGFLIWVALSFVLMPTLQYGDHPPFIPDMPQPPADIPSDVLGLRLRGTVNSSDIVHYTQNAAYIISRPAQPSETIVLAFEEISSLGGNWGYYGATITCTPQCSIRPEAESGSTNWGDTLGGGNLPARPFLTFQLPTSDAPLGWTSITAEMVVIYPESTGIGRFANKSRKVTRDVRFYVGTEDEWDAIQDYKRARDFFDSQTSAYKRWQANNEFFIRFPILKSLLIGIWVISFLSMLIGYMIARIDDWRAKKHSKNPVTP